MLIAYLDCCCPDSRRPRSPSAQAPAGRRPPGRRPAAHPPRPPGAQAYIISPKDGATVTSPVLVQFRPEGDGCGAGRGSSFDNTGHHHLLIDTPTPPQIPGAPAPGDRQDRALRKRAGPRRACPLSPGKQHPASCCSATKNHVPHKPAGDLQQDHHHGRQVARQRKAPPSANHDARRSCTSDMDAFLRLGGAAR